MVRLRQLVLDPQPCPYLPGREETLTFLVPTEPLTGEQFDQALSAGFRRAGPGVYRPACQGCAACTPLRLDLKVFKPTASQGRTRRRNRDLTIEVGPATATPERARLFARHAVERALGSDEGKDLEGFAGHFVRSCTTTLEVAYRAGERLVGLSILDVGREAVSSVYHCFEPDEARRSLGVYSVVWETEWAAAQGYRWYYLGYWVGECRHLSYKARYRPHERRGPRGWEPFDGADADAEERDRD